MTSAVYLEHYLDSLEHLPIELQRNFTLMRDLDSRAQCIMRNIDKMADDFMNNMKTMSSEKKKEMMNDIQAQFNKAKEYGDDKVQLAIQTYELVDKHIRRLDSDLARFESEIQDKAMSNTRNAQDDQAAQKKRKARRREGWNGRHSGNRAEVLPPAKADPDQVEGAPLLVKSRLSIGGRKKLKEEKKKKRGGGSSEEESVVKMAKKKKKGGGKGGTGPAKGGAATGSTTDSGLSTLPTLTHGADVLDMPVDPNEPTYCLCHQVSYGEMIGCDNPDCPIEWFHFACVALTTKPKGKWFCPKCSADRKKK